MNIEYDEVAAARELILDDIRATFQGVPLSVEHYILAEYRLQTLISAELVGAPTNVKIANEIESKKQNEG